MTLGETIEQSIAVLAAHGVESPRVNVEWLLAQATGIRRSELCLHSEEELPETAGPKFAEWIRRRSAREPLQHILGTVPFCGLELKVGPGALIPRPETELLAEQGWLFLQERAGPCVPKRVIDYGTGTGCLALALALRVPAVRVTAVDISRAALQFARENRDRLGLPQVQLIQSDGLSALLPKREHTLLISNPPYIPSDAIGDLAPEVRDHDPRCALDGGPDGLRFYDQLAREGSRYLVSGGRMMLELGDGMAPAVTEMLGRRGWIGIKIIPDYTGRERIVIAEPPET